MVHPNFAAHHNSKAVILWEKQSQPWSRGDVERRQGKTGCLPLAGKLEGAWKLESRTLPSNIHVLFSVCGGVLTLGLFHGGRYGL